MKPRLLISVRDADEACIAIEAGADLIDLKDPAAGALGAVDLRLASRIVTMVGGQRTTSAAVGDLPPDASILGDAARRMASTGVGYVKVGFMCRAGAEVCDVIRKLAPVARDVALIAVVFADALPAGNPVAAAAAAGFAGVMLDTADKRGGRLLDYLAVSPLRGFVASARAARLICGLAGSLRHDDIPRLAELGPDYLGFRGAACRRSHRDDILDARQVALLRKTLDGSATGSLHVPDLERG